jgi:hypothetical protein
MKQMKQERAVQTRKRRENHQNKCVVVRECVGNVCVIAGEASTYQRAERRLLLLRRDLGERLAGRERRASPPKDFV